SAVPTIAARQPEARDLDRRAAVHHHLDALRLGAGSRGPIDDTELHPDDFGADRDRLIDNRPGGLAAAEHIDHVDRLPNFVERAVAALAEDSAAGGERVDRDRD